jgi:hypothetical protein
MYIYIHFPYISDVLDRLVYRRTCPCISMNGLRYLRHMLLLFIHAPSLHTRSFSSYTLLLFIHAPSLHTRSFFYRLVRHDLDRMLAPNLQVYLTTSNGS